MLNQDRTAIYHNGLLSAESFLHQKQIGFTASCAFDSANRETLAHALCKDVRARVRSCSARVCPNDSAEILREPSFRRQLDR